MLNNNTNGNVHYILNVIRILRDILSMAKSSFNYFLKKSVMQIQKYSAFTYIEVMTRMNYLIHYKFNVIV